MGALDGDSYEVSAADVAALTEALARIKGRGDNSDPRGSSIADEHEPRRLLTLAAALHRARRRRDEATPGLFSEPAYDILLDLFVAHGEGRLISISSAAIASGAPGTTALRYIEALVLRGFIARRPDHLDGRRSYLLLTEAGLDLMSRHLADLDFSLR